jgi:transcriptional regulator with XRE-family HTH domain
MHIGNTLKKLRKQRGLTLSELAEATGIQLSTLSRIENKKMRGTVDCHLKIARALSIDITQLYADAMNEDKPIDMKVTAPALDVVTPNETASRQILASHVLSKKMLPALLQIEPQGKTNLEQSAVGSEQFIYVLEGTADMIINDKAYTLKPHHCLYFNAAQKHYLINHTNAPVKLLSVTTPVNL